MHDYMVRALKLLHWLNALTTILMLGLACTAVASPAAPTARLRAALARSRRPMLLADDQRRWVTGNAAACGLLGIAADELAWHSMDDFTPASEHARLTEQWTAFLTHGTAEGRYELYVAGGEPVPLEFGAIAHVLPARHLAVFMPPEEGSADEASAHAPVRAPEWAAVVTPNTGRIELSSREREILTMIACGLQNNDIATQLILSPETIKSHVQNTMSKLGARTRAQAVAIALVADEIAWEPGSGRSEPPDR